MEIIENDVEMVLRSQSRPFFVGAGAARLLLGPESPFFIGAGAARLCVGAGAVPKGNAIHFYSLNNN